MIDKNRVFVGAVAKHIILKDLQFEGCIKDEYIKDLFDLMIIPEGKTKIHTETTVQSGDLILRGSIAGDTPTFCIYGDYFANKCSVFEESVIFEQLIPETVLAEQRAKIEGGAVFGDFVKMDLHQDRKMDCLATHTNGTILEYQFKERFIGERWDKAIEGAEGPAPIITLTTVGAPLVES